eukprot:4197841-Pyramimonas_sp.AAC.3
MRGGQQSGAALKGPGSWNSSSTGAIIRTSASKYTTCTPACMQKSDDIMEGRHASDYDGSRGLCVIRAGGNVLRNILRNNQRNVKDGRRLADEHNDNRRASRL